MKILILPIVTPYPLDNGGAVAQYAVLDYLQDKCDITVCCRAYSNIDVQNINKLKDKLPKVKFEIINFAEDNANLYQLSINRNSLKRKIRNAIRFIYKNLKHILKLEKQNKILKPEIKDEFKDSYRTNPVVLKSEFFINKLTTIIKSESWDIIQAEFYEMLELVTLFPPECKKVFVNHEARSLRLESAKKVSSSSIEFCNYIISINKLYETELLKKYDSVIVFSNDDKSRLEYLGISNIETSAFPVLNSEFIEISPFKKLKQLVFIGGASHYPNREGLNWFIEEIYPSIYEKYKLPLIIIGNWSDEYKIASAVGEIIYMGYVESILDVIKDSVQVVPVRIGNGIRTKILLGMAMKMPIITTSLGVEGISVNDYKEIFFADKIEDYLEKIEFILKNEDHIQCILESAYGFVKRNYSQEEVGLTRMKIYKKITHD